MPMQSMKRHCYGVINRRNCDRKKIGRKIESEPDQR